MIHLRSPLAVEAKPPKWLRRTLWACGLLLAAHLGYGTIYWAYSLPSERWLPLDENFESGDLRAWQGLGRRQLCCEHSAQVVSDPIHPDRKVARFELRREDPLVRGNKRAEMRLPAAHMGDELVYGISVYLPPAWRDDPLPVNLFQWHSVPDKLLFEGGPSQPLRLVVIGNQWIIDNLWDAKRVTKFPLLRETPQGRRVLWSGPTETGRWVKWEFKVRWAHDTSGLVEIRKDGKLIVSQSGPNTYNDFIAPYFKFGVYVPSWSYDSMTSPVTSRVAYFDNVHVHRP